jgi:phosphate:Na+ symporter
MIELNLLTAILSALVLFLFAIQSLGHELELKFKDQLKSTLSKATRYPVTGILTGMLGTGIIQSSTAVSVICVSLVSGGILSLAQSITILMGSNIGTTLTAQLVALKMTGAAPVLLVLGYFVNFLPGKIGVWGKPIFYFGLLFFGLNMLSEVLGQFQHHPLIRQYMLGNISPYWGLFIGAILTILLQSSSITSGLVIVFASEGLLQLNVAIPILIGANVGTTSTAILASFTLGPDARRTAMANFLINLAGLLIFIPFLGLFTRLIDSLDIGLSYKVANAHLSFNVITVMIIFPFRNKLATFLEHRIK